MSKEFNETLQKAMSMIKKEEFSYRQKGIFNWIYPFTTENISGYIDLFDLKNKSLLTVGSSGDQVINAAFYGCKDITVLDVCPFTKFYFYLKNAGRISLDYEQFINFFYRRDFEGSISDVNDNSFDIEMLNEIFPVLKEVDLESFKFWKELYNRFESKKIRDLLFSHDESSKELIKSINPYLKSEEAYNYSKKVVENITPNFIIGNIFDLDLSNSYDNILLSNLGSYYPLKRFKRLIDKLSLNLNDNGKLLICYLYNRDNTQPLIIYDDGRPEIYNKKEAYDIFEDFITNYDSFLGIRGLKLGENSIKDSVLIYEKKKNLNQ